MAEQLRIQGKYLTAGETAEVLGVSKKRADQFITMLQASGTPPTSSTRGATIKMNGGAAKKRGVKFAFPQRKALSEPVFELPVKQARPAKTSAKKLSSARAASKKLRPASGSSVKTSAKRYASKKAVAKKG